MPGQLYSVTREGDGRVRLWQDEWAEAGDDTHVGDLHAGDVFMIVAHAGYEDSWVVTRYGVCIIEGVSYLCSKNLITPISRAHEGSGVTP